MIFIQRIYKEVNVVFKMLVLRLVFIANNYRVGIRLLEPLGNERYSNYPVSEIQKKKKTI